VHLPGNKLYYSFKVGDFLFVVLDSDIAGQEKKITDGQYEWLKRVLSAAGFQHKFVFVHHPLYPAKGRHYGESLDEYPAERDRLDELFVRDRVDMVFVGHQHLYLRKSKDGVMQIITGGGGAPLYAGDREGGFYHFVLVTVDGDRVKGKVIDIDGKVRDTFKF
jgi:3',5'-cyclic AMP phosphodiesterase CpdA